MITIKSAYEIKLMREAGRIVAVVHEELKKIIKPGTTLLELDARAEKVIRAHKAKPSFKGYGGFPGSICASVNDVLIHGIPNNYALKDGDVISVDVGACYKGYHGDAAFTKAVGKVDDLTKQLMEVTRQSLEIGREAAQPGATTGDIGYAVQKFVEDNGFHVVRDFSGHGIGKKLHEDPMVPNYGKPGTGVKLKPGMTICVEPMVLVKSHLYSIDSDEWTVRSMDGLNTCHDEYQLLITEYGNEILTKL